MILSFFHQSLPSCVFSYGSKLKKLFTDLRIAFYVTHDRLLHLITALRLISDSTGVTATATNFLT